MNAVPPCPREDTQQASRIEAERNKQGLAGVRARVFGCNYAGALFNCDCTDTAGDPSPGAGVAFVSGRSRGPLPGNAAAGGSACQCHTGGSELSGRQTTAAF